MPESWEFHVFHPPHVLNKSSHQKYSIPRRLCIIYTLPMLLLEGATTKSVPLKCKRQATENTEDAKLKEEELQHQCFRNNKMQQFWILLQVCPQAPSLPGLEQAEPSVTSLLFHKTCRLHWLQFWQMFP